MRLGSYSLQSRREGLARRSRVGCLMVAGLKAPLHGGVSFCKNFRVLHVARTLWFEHVDGIFSLRNEVRLVLPGFRAFVVIELGEHSLLPILPI